MGGAGGKDGNGEGGDGKGGDLVVTRPPRDKLRSRRSRAAALRDVARRQRALIISAATRDGLGVAVGAGEVVAVVGAPAGLPEFCAFVPSGMSASVMRSARIMVNGLVVIDDMMPD